MSEDKTTRHNRVREALSRIYEQQPPYFREYLRRFREDPSSRVFAPLAEAYRKMGRIEEAIEICQEGLKHHSDFYGGRVALAKCYLARKRYVEAKAELERVVQAVPENLLAQKLLGETCEALEQKPAALHCYKMALLLAPNDIGLADRVHRLEKELLEKPSADTDLQPLNPVSEVSIPSPAQVAAPSVPEEDFDEPSMPPVRSFDSDVQPEELSLAVAPPAPQAPALWQENEDAPEEGSEESESSDQINALLGYSESGSDVEGYSVKALDGVFVEAQSGREITTETLGDLYFSQGQFKRAFLIFQKTAMSHPTAALTKKMNACREKMGMAQEEMAKARQVAYLQKLLDRVRENPPVSPR